MNFKVKNQKKLSSLLSVLLILVVISLNYVQVMASETTDMVSKIKAKYSDNTWLGDATTAYMVLSDGMYRHYENGSIYLGKSVGVACVVKGMIRDKWKTMGWQKSFLGYPTTDELTATDGVGRYNHFEKGSIYWYPGAGAFEVHGLIRSKWKSMGWEKSVLGYPLSDELVTSDGRGRYSIFQNGRIYYHPTYGTHYIQYGKFYLNWADNGMEAGTVGYPTSDPYLKYTEAGAGGYLAQDFSKRNISERDINIASSVDLRGEINRRGIAIRNQGPRPTCVQHAMTFILEYALTGIAGQEFNHLSIDYSTQATNRVNPEKDKNGNIEESLGFGRFLEGYEKYGTVVSRSWPYNTSETYDFNEFDKKMIPELISDGKFMIRKGLKLNISVIGRENVTEQQRLNSVIGYLNKGIPVAYAANGHAMAIVGYVKDINEPGGGHVILKNSHGVNRDDRGYRYVSFADFKTNSPGLCVVEGIEK